MLVRLASAPTLAEHACQMCTVISSLDPVVCPSRTHPWPSMLARLSRFRVPMPTHTPHVSCLVWSRPTPIPPRCPAQWHSGPDSEPRRQPIHLTHTTPLGQTPSGDGATMVKSSRAHRSSICVMHPGAMPDSRIQPVPRTTACLAALGAPVSTYAPHLGSPLGDARFPYPSSVKHDGTSVRIQSSSAHRHTRRVVPWIHVPFLYQLCAQHGGTSGQSQSPCTHLHTPRRQRSWAASVPFRFFCPAGWPPSWIQSSSAHCHTL